MKVEKINSISNATVSAGLFFASLASISAETTSTDSSKSMGRKFNAEAPHKIENQFIDIDFTIPGFEKTINGDFFEHPINYKVFDRIQTHRNVYEGRHRLSYIIYPGGQWREACDPIPWNWLGRDEYYCQNLEFRTVSHFAEVRADLEEVEQDKTYILSLNFSCTRDPEINFSINGHRLAVRLNANGLDSFSEQFIEIPRELLQNGENSIRIEPIWGYFEMKTLSLLKTE